MQPPKANPLKRYRDSAVIWIAVGIMVVGSGSLLASILAAALGLIHEPNPNPVGLGILCG